MIRSRSNGGPFSRSRCPFDDEGEQCKRPFCPYFHPFSGASALLANVKEEVQDDDIIVVHEKVAPTRCLTSNESSVTNTVTTQKPLLFETSIIQKENPITDQYSCGYFGYVAPNVCVESTDHVTPSSYGNPLTSNNLPQQFEKQHNTKDLPKEEKSHHKKRKDKRIISAPSYTPTPIIQLEREEEERKKRKELAERQKNIRDRLKQQDLECNQKTNEKDQLSKNVIDPIDQIMATQENLLKDKREQKLEDLAKLDLEKKKQKERLEQQDEMKKKKKGIKLKSGDICCGPILAAAPQKIKENPKNEHQPNKHNDLKEKEVKASNSNEDVWLGKKRIEETFGEHEKKVEDWKTKTKVPTVIDNILSAKRQQHSSNANTNGFGNMSKKLGFYKIMDHEKRKSDEKCDQGIHANLKMVSDLNKEIDAIEEELRQSSSKSSDPSSSSFSNKNLVSTVKNNDEKKRVPIWRQEINANSDVALEEKINRARKSSDKIINSLFEDGDLPSEKSSKKDKLNKKLHLSTVSIVHKRRRNSSSSDGNKKKSKNDNEEDQETLKEKQALVDLLSDNEDPLLCNVTKCIPSNVYFPLSSKIGVKDIKMKEIKDNNIELGRNIISSEMPVTSSISEFEPQKLLTPTISLSVISSSTSVVPSTQSPISSPMQNSISPIVVNTELSKPKTMTNKRVIPSAQEQLHSRTLLSINQSLNNQKLPAEVQKSSSTDSFSSSQNNQRNLSKSHSIMSNTAFNNSFNDTCHLKNPSTVSMNLNCSTSNTFSTTMKTFPSTLKKGEERKAHLNVSAKNDHKKLIPLEPNNRKVALQIRQSRLAMIHVEYAKIFPDDPKMAVENAQHEEKEVLDRCSTRIGYVSAIPNVLKKLRNFIANKDSVRKSSDSISHENVLLGRHADSVTVGMQRAKRVAQHKASHLSESDFYNELEVYLLSDDQLWYNGYPRWTTLTQEIDNETDSLHEGNKTIVEIHESELDLAKGYSKSFVPDSDFKRVCSRCGKEYLLKQNGDYAYSDECIYHWGRAWKKKMQGVVEARYTCCQSTLDVRGCVVAGRHVTQTLRLSTLEQYVSTPKPYGIGDPRSTKVYALDCEMVYSNWGPEVARVSVVDVLGELVLDLLIRPENTLIDCNTRFSGLTADQILHAECDLDKARERLFELVNCETILIGHSLESDLRALRLVHTRVVDTSIVFPHRLGPPQKKALKTLASEILQLIIQEDEGGHDSKEDALVCMRIMLRKIRAGEF